MIQDKIFFDEKDPTGVSYNTPFTVYGSYEGRLWSKTPSGEIKYYTQNSDLSVYATTGSNSFNGNQTVTGSLTVTEGITGTATTASYVEYTGVANKPTLVSGSEQVSFNGIVDKPTLVSGSSQITYSGISSIPAGIVSSSAQVGGYGIFATTGSNQFNGSQAITGSLTVTGQVVAQTLNVQQVTSSIVFSSGSNIFGNSLSNTQQLTGSVSVTGSLAVNGVGTFASSVTALGTATFLGQFGNGNIVNEKVIQFLRSSSSTDIVNIQGINAGVGPGNITLQASGGNVGIGTDSPKAKLHVNSSIFSGGSEAGFEINGANSYMSLTVGVGISRGIRTSVVSNSGYAGLTIDNMSGTFSTSGLPSSGTYDTNLFYINGQNGNIGIATNDPITRLQLRGYAGARLPYINGTANTFDNQGITVASANSGNAAIGGGLDLTNNTYSVNAYSPIISFSSRSSSGDYNNSYAGIWGQLLGPGGDSNWVVGALVFGTASSYGITEQMRIRNDGNVGIGLTSPPTRLSLVGGSTMQFGIDGNSGNNLIYLRGGSTGDKANIILNHYGYADYHIAVGHTANTLLSLTKTLGGTDGIIINSSGNVGIGTVSPTRRLTVQNLVDDGTLQIRMQGPGETTSFCEIGRESASTGDFRINVCRTGTVINALRIADTTGAVTIPGSLSKGSGSFKINHPLPSKKDTHHLVHSFIEGPQADNIYRGKIQLVNGKATVNLDQSARMTEGTFVLLNGNTQCFTSNESGWTAVKGIVAGNTLTIEAQNPECTDTISWLVVGERIDQHMLDTEWTDENGKVITEPLKQ
jgi:hypothetical protein